LPFEYGCLRKVIVQDNVNTIIGMGGVGRNLVQFELKWHCRSDGTIERLKDRERAPLEENPRLARTMNETDTVLPSRRETRIHTPGPQPPKMRYVSGGVLGAGQFGVVYKAVNVDSGKFMAVKKMVRPARVAQQEEWMKLRREVEILSRISHEHVVDYISSQGWNGPEVEIFMGLKEGTSTSLVYGKCSIPIADLAQTVLHHMLQAIDCLAMQGIIHRDVKPENILYISRQGQYHFQLGDFGLSNRQIIAATYSGTPLYMAPEMFQNGEQTHKVDVWSLFVTMLWTLNTQGFREVSNSFKAHQDARSVILSVASHVDVIREMARINPEERASSAQMLVKCYSGKGLTTPRNQVPPLISLAKADRKASASVGPVSTSPVQTKPRGLRKTVNPATAGAQFRVEKARIPQAQPRQPVTLVSRQIPGGFPGGTINSSAYGV
ncbi:kinase-like domain-containing protein, partial [Thelonectria olida]